MSYFKLATQGIKETVIFSSPNESANIQPDVHLCESAQTGWQLHNRPLRFLQWLTLWTYSLIMTANVKKWYNLPNERTENKASEGEHCEQLLSRGGCGREPWISAGSGHACGAYGEWVPCRHWPSPSVPGRGNLAGPGEWETSILLSGLLVGSNSTCHFDQCVSCLGCWCFSCNRVSLCWARNWVSKGRGKRKGDGMWMLAWSWHAWRLWGWWWWPGPQWASCWCRSSGLGPPSPGTQTFYSLYHLGSFSNQNFLLFLTLLWKKVIWYLWKPSGWELDV